MTTVLFKIQPPSTELQQLQVFLNLLKPHPHYQALPNGHVLNARYWAKWAGRPAECLCLPLSKITRQYRTWLTIIISAMCKINQQMQKRVSYKARFSCNAYPTLSGDFAQQWTQALIWFVIQFYHITGIGHVPAGDSSIMSTGLQKSLLPERKQRSFFLCLWEVFALKKQNNTELDAEVREVIVFTLTGDSIFTALKKLK